MRWAATAALLSLLVLRAAPAAAQAQVSIGGLVESYVGRDTRTTTGDTSSTTDERFLYGSRYAPTADGFIWHRRFLTFSASGMFADQTIDETHGRTELLQTEPYRVQLTFFPEAPHTFTVRANRATYRTDAFAEGGQDSLVTTTTRTEGVAWNYRGSAVLPAAGLDFARTTTDTEAIEGPTAQTLTTLSLHATRNFERWNPTVRYRLDVQDDERPLDPAGEVSGIAHTFEYSDRIRVGERVFITPSASYTINPLDESLRSATTLLVPIAGPINPTLDGTATLRYSLGQGNDRLDHTLAADGALTKRVRRDLTVSGGLNSIALQSEDSLTWGAGGFTSADAEPLADLKTTGTYGLQFTGGDAGTSVLQRAQLGATSTHLPRHTVTGNYFLNVIDAPTQESLLVVHAWRAAINSVALPRTVLDAGYGLELQDGDGSQVAHDAQLTATITPPIAMQFRVGADFTQRSSRGGDRVPTEESGWGVHAAVEGTPFDWLTLTLAGRRGMQHVVREDREGDFVSERLSGGATFLGRLFQLHGEAFVEREPVVDRSGYGVRGTVSYRFRVWTLSLEAEQTWGKSVGTDTGQQRVFFRVVRPLSHFFSFR